MFNLFTSCARASLSRDTNFALFLLTFAVAMKVPSRCVILMTISCNCSWLPVRMDRSRSRTSRVSAELLRRELEELMFYVTSSDGGHKFSARICVDYRIYLVDESAEAVEGSRSNLLALHAWENTREMGKIKFISKILTRISRWTKLFPLKCVWWWRLRKAPSTHIGKSEIVHMKFSPGP